MGTAEIAAIITGIGVIISSVGVIVSSFSLRTAIKSLEENQYVLKENHEWNRRNHACTIITQWNEKTSIHRKEIERIKPGLIDLFRGSVTAISPKEAVEIYESNADKGDLWTLRFNIIEILNHLESISVAHDNHVADRGMLKGSLKGIMDRYHYVLKPFIVHVKTCLGYDPWEPFSNLMATWSVPDKADTLPTGEVRS